MRSFSEEEFRYFDAYEDPTNSADAKSDDCLDVCDSHSFVGLPMLEDPRYDLWFRSLGSVQERRSKFLNWIGVGLDQNVKVNSIDGWSVEGEMDRARQSSGAILRNSFTEEEFCSPRSAMPYFSVDGSLEEICSSENFQGKGSFGGTTHRSVHEEGHDRRVCESCDIQSRDSETSLVSKNSSGSPFSFQQLIEKDTDDSCSLMGTPRRSKKGWLFRLRSITCSFDKQQEAEILRHDDDFLLQYRAQRVKVHQCGKRVKELSAVNQCQDIQAHEGSILTMKFSPDGQYLASGGVDGIVRVWQIIEDERSNELDIPEIDPSCIYFTVNHLSALKPLFVDKERTTILRSLRKTSDSACVIFPPKIFRILEKPLHEFHGHNGEILDLSWSKNSHLLSASEDKTVRLWHIGDDTCLRVFLHSNYVTSVQFNPVDDNYFMSGSIDGKVRIWEVTSCQVFDWTDAKDIITAVCYSPDGQGGIIGTISGNCRFYSLSDNHLQLNSQICLHSKKKSPCKRITGLRFCPQDSSKVMVTCADSQVRILQGLNVIGKFKGQKNAANQNSACFTSDGKLIISASEDSNVYIWNCNDQEEHVPQAAKNVKSCERFSTNASIAIPWGGLNNRNIFKNNRWGGPVSDDNSPEALPLTSPSRFSLSEDYFLDSFPKGSATWPEEKLPISSPLFTSSSSLMHTTRYKFLKASCQNTFSSHAWGLVIVTAGHDGRIKSFHNYGLPVSV